MAHIVSAHTNGIWLTYNGIWLTAAANRCGKNSTNSSSCRTIDALWLGYNI